MAVKLNIDIIKLKELHSKGMSNSEISRELKCCRDWIRLKLLDNNLIPNKPTPHRHTDAEKKVLSIKRKQYLKENPDKHPWRNNNKFKSEPCEKLKGWLDSKNIPYIPEYAEHGVGDRNFSIDVAMPDKMIALEVNGNQHYNRDGTLKDYYKEREELLESVGWKVYQIHYSMCFKIDKLENILLNLTTSPVKANFDYKSYVKFAKIYKCLDCQIEIKRGNLRCDMCRNKNKIIKPTIVRIPRMFRTEIEKLCVDCGDNICLDADRCIHCHKIYSRKVNRPDKETLHRLIWETPLSQLKTHFKVSDNAIRKWCKSYNLATPSNKYWGNFHSGNILDYQI